MSILVIGAANIDILADYSSEDASAVDKPGSVSYGFGGTAYNISVNLGRQDFDVELYSCFPSDSPFRDSLEAELAEEPIGTSYFSFNEEMERNVFVGLREDGELSSAVTSNGLPDIELNEEALTEAIDNATIVVADCNLSEDQLDSVVVSANESNTPVVIAGVSQLKANKMVNIHATVDVVVINDDESEGLFNEGVDPEFVNAETVLVTHGDDGFTVHKGQATMEFDAPEVESIENTTGAGDAALSGLVAYMMAESEEMDWNDASEYINKFATSVLSRVPPRVAGKL